MFTGEITPAILQRSVVSVPPLARHADVSLNQAANAAILAFMRAGGISTFMYGGNANMYNVGLKEYPRLLDLLEEIAGPDEWIIPSIGVDYGKACDQIDILKTRRFPTAMLVPPRFAATPDGVIDGMRRLADRYGKPLVAYVKEDGYIDPAALAGLLKSGHVCCLKYSIVRQQPEHDAFLSALLPRSGVERVISGLGERPVVVHARDFGLRTFTSGSVCVGPRLATLILHAIQKQDWAEAQRLREPFMPLEDERDAHGPVAVIHEAMRLAGIADTGRFLPFMTNIEDANVLKAVETAARALRALNDKPAQRAAE